MNKHLLLTIVTCLALTANAQTGSDYMQAFKIADANVTFDVNAKGKEFRVKWGMDTAWNWDFNVYCGVAHIGKGNFETGRISFQPTAEVIDHGDGTYELTDKQKEAMRSRCKNILLTGCNKVEINNDQEDALNKENGNYNKYQSIYLNKPEAWYKLIKASVAYAKECGVEVVSIAPFNEPDYTAWGQGTKDSMKDICRLIKADPYFDGIRVCAGNTLNCDCALEWYNHCLDYIDEGNTHQLAGSFDTYAAFFQKVKQDGKVGTADELHNVGEAIVGTEYGMETGIWWGFDSKARGQFCIDSNEGVRIGYGENRPAWTSGAVYRNEQTGEVHGYLGSSERQAVASSFAFISTTKDVYFNGYGPTRMYVYDVPGGKKGDYQAKTQINAERLFDITWGEDVAPFEVNGTYQIMNIGSKKLLTMNNNDATIDARNGNTNQQWNVYPGYTAGDCSYWFIDNAGNTNMHLNSVLNWGNLSGMFLSGANVITYNTGTNHPMEEQWYVKYAQNGAYYIINRLTNKYLYCNSSTNGTSITSKTPPAEDAKQSEVNKYLWRFLPTDLKVPTLTVLKAPAAPTALTAKQRTASIELAWQAPADPDVIGYNILRAEVATEEDATPAYNTIGRMVNKPTFFDNTVVAGKQYLYKVQAVDEHYNRSDASEPILAAPLRENALICQLQFDDNLLDNSANHIDPSFYGVPNYSTTKNSGTKSLNLTGTTYAMLPYAATHQDEMTIAIWVRWNSNGKNWERLFDFGNGEQQYMFFTPSNGSQMRFVMKNNGDEQILTNNKKLATTSWHHIAVTLKPTGDKVQAILYLDGTNVAESNDFTIKPSDIAPSVCYIGRSMFPADPLFNGRIDDFRIYNYALTADEIAAVMEDRGEQSKDLNDHVEDVIPTSIHAPESENGAWKTDNGTWYNLNGQPVSENEKGILLQSGKKKLNR